MSSISIYSSQGSDYPASALVDVYLTEKPDPRFAQGTELFPRSDGTVALYPRDLDEDMRFYQMGRTVASAGIFNVILHVDQNLWIKDAENFLMGMYDGRHDITAVFDLPPQDIEELKLLVKISTAAREIAGSPSKVYTPETLVDALGALCRMAAAESKHGRVTVTKILPGDPAFERYTGLKAVSAGSANPACMGIIDFNPGTKRRRKDLFAVVGKGINFDAGGYDLKPPKFMDSMHTDKYGAVMAAASLAFAIVVDGADMKHKVRVYLPCCENLVSGTSMLPGDIITYPDGKTVEITNTDAEGRLVLADGILQAQDDGAACIMELSTLTGAAKNAVGREFTAYTLQNFSKSLQIAVEGTLYRYRFWPLPCEKFHQRCITGTHTDLVNSAPADSGPGFSTAAAFLKAFAGDKVPFMHFDLSSAYCPKGSPWYAAGLPTAQSLGSFAHLIGRWHDLLEAAECSEQLKDEPASYADGFADELDGR